MKNYNKEVDKKYVADYDLDSKILVHANIGIIYARLLENKSQYDEALKVCEALLLSPLNPHTRKLINSIKARVSGMAKTAGKGGPIISDKGKAGQSSLNNDQVIFEVVSQLEIIQNNTNKGQSPDLIKKCYETLNTWKAKENDETELELHAELWARLAKLALNEANPQLYKYSLKSVEISLSLLNSAADLAKIPVTRLRWYSLAEYLYSETLLCMINPATQEKESQEKFLFHALKHSIEAANKGCKALINILVLDAAKQFWNICTKLQDSAVNRRALIKPIFSMIFYLKTVKEMTEPDLVLLLNRLLTQAALENNEFKLGENVADMAFELVPKHLQKTIWESKMNFMSKQGKNELQAISNMKEADPSLQAKIWLRLGRAATNINKQFTAYTKAIELLKKEESVEIVDVLIEFAEWLMRNGYDYKTLTEHLFWAADILIEIEIDADEEDEDDEGGEEEKTKSNIYSRSSRGKKSNFSKSKSKVTKSKRGPSKKSKSVRKGADQKTVVSKASGRSKSSVGSRLSKASIRGTKTIKTKQSKSIFTEKEEEPNPEMLNCSHYDKLLRIHGMLAIIAKTNEEALKYCLDAKFFIMKMFELSIKTLNIYEANNVKLNQVKDEKALKPPLQNPIPGQIKPVIAGAKPDSIIEDIKFSLPEKLEQWINYQPPKEFTERIKTTENNNIISKYTFEKAELTYSYMVQIIKILESLGHDLHCVEIYAFMRFYVIEKEHVMFPLSL